MICPNVRLHSSWEESVSMVSGGGMALELRQQLKLAQQLVMTPQLQQAIKLLQLARLELVDTIQQEIEQNPLLEEITPGQESEGENGEMSPTDIGLEFAGVDKTSEVNVESSSTLGEINWNDYENEYERSSYSPQGAESGDLPSRLDILAQKPDLQSHLKWQLNFSDVPADEKEVGLYIIGNLNRDGFLDADNEDIIRETGCDPEVAERMVKKIQELDPTGVGARSVRESLLLQLDRLGLANSLPTMLVRDHLKLLETKNTLLMVKATGRPLEEIQAAIKVIVNLNPYPGRVYSDDEPQYIVPDVYVYKMGDEYVIMLNDDGLPRLRVSSYYKDVMKKDAHASAETKDYIQNKVRSATWLIKSIQQRQRTIYRTVESLVRFQKDFFEKGVGHLRPLILRDVAEDIEMHESTISRVTTNKYMHTPQGTFELKYFFNTGIDSYDGDADSVASMSVKARIRQMIQGENSNKPLSDQAISNMFKKENIRVARRTVAKYREQLRILPSKFRKEYKSAM